MLNEIERLRAATRARGRRAALVGLVAAAGVTTGGGTAGAYRLNGLDWSYKGSPMGEAWEVCTAGMPSGAAAVIKRAAAVWNYTRFRFTFKANGCSSGGTFPRLNGVNQIDFGSRDPGVLATNVSIGGERRTQECDLRFARNAPWYVGTGRVPDGRVDLYSVAVHEFGHCLGLAHSSIRQRPVMYPSLRFGETRRTLRDDDRRGRAAIYGGG
jgi:hypothetical protein